MEFENGAGPSCYGGSRTCAAKEEDADEGGVAEGACDGERGMGGEDGQGGSSAGEPAVGGVGSHAH